jgi:hypothetical protein
VLTRVLCSPTAFSFEPAAVTIARLDRAQLGEFDALVIGLFLMAHFEEQIVVPDFGFYGRDLHSALIREERLIAGVNFLDELPDDLSQLVRLVDTVPKERRLTTPRHWQSKRASYAGRMRTMTSCRPPALERAFMVYCLPASGIRRRSLCPTYFNYSTLNSS